MFLSLFRKKPTEIPKKEVKEVSQDDNELKYTVYGELCGVFFTNLKIERFLDLIRTIKDPEKPNTLEELNVVYEEGVEVIWYIFSMINY
jgi:hypothetical protein